MSAAHVCVHEELVDILYTLRPAGEANELSACSTIMYFLHSPPPLRCVRCGCGHSAGEGGPRSR